MKFSLKNKTAIVTGGGSGIGAAIVAALRNQGARVHILELKGSGEDVHQCDITDQSGVKATVDTIAAGGNIDILVNNAGIGMVGNLEATTGDDLDRLYAVNVKGTYNCLSACIPHMKARGGVIVNMASVAATVGIADRFAYSMSKGAVLSMTYSIAKDYVADGIRCNSISPARVHTPFVDNFLAKNYPGREVEMFRSLEATQPIGRMGKPEEIADLTLYLCSEEASFITGTDFPIDGGFIRLHG